ncbi:hypothetical protein AGMMS49525_13370 [Bacteroidia bacterium]|nr:hypothetical protein AGMMS49525_13370 [Bacteroidia bacterium]
MINLVYQYFEFGRLNTGLLITAGIVFLCTSLSICYIRYQRLETQIKEDGIYVRFFPYQKQYKHLAWEEISKLYVRQYRPLLEYGGWGFNYRGYKKTLTVSGNMGLQIEFTNGKKLLIGTQKPDELTELLNKMGKISIENKNISK